MYRLFAAKKLFRINRHVSSVQSDTLMYAILSLSVIVTLSDALIFSVVMVVDVLSKCSAFDTISLDDVRSNSRLGLASLFVVCAVATLLSIRLFTVFATDVVVAFIRPIRDKIPFHVGVPPTSSLACWIVVSPVTVDGMVCVIVEP